MDTITGTVTAKRKDGKGVQINNGDWYSVFDASDLNGVNKGDSVQFDYIQKGQWNNIKGPVSVTGTGSTTPLNSGGGAKGYNVGVEIGHAWNSAVQIVKATNDTKDQEAFIRNCINVAARVYAVCGAMRESAAAGTLDGTSPLEGNSPTVLEKAMGKKDMPAVPPLPETAEVEGDI